MNSSTHALCSPDHAAESWHVQYRDASTDRIARYPSPEKAIEAACRLIDGGCDVYGIGTGPLSDSIERDQIAKIYALWARKNKQSNPATDMIEVLLPSQNDVA